MWNLKACRACLTTEGKLERIDVKSRRIFTCITDLKVADGDGLPQFLCAECYALIKKALAFRRKSRRAYFVLKEIQLVKKEVTQNEVLKVDRTKANLISSLSIWNSKNIIMYTCSNTDNITEELESDLEKKLEGDHPHNSQKQNGAKSVTFDFNLSYNEDNKKYNLLINPLIEPEDKSTNNNDLKLTKKNFNFVNSTAVLIDISPDNCKEKEIDSDVEEGQNIEELLKKTRDDGDDDVPGDIDMDDVFKGLKEDTESETDYELPDEFDFPKDEPPKPPKEETKIESQSEKVKRKKKKRKITFISPAKSYKVALMFSISEIRYLSIDEQKAQHMLKMTELPSNMPYKCDICVCAFKMYTSFQHHITLHSQRAHIYEHVCEICNETFEHKENLEQHGAEKHWYEYSCGLCKKKHTTLEKLLICLQERIAIDLKSESIYVQKKIIEEFAITPLSQQNMYNTLKNWTLPIGVNFTNTNYLCQDCNIAYVDIKCFEQHVDMHKSGKEKGYRKYFTCDICNLTFDKYVKLEKHMHDWHLYLYVCKKCDSCFWNKQQARRHFVKRHKPSNWRQDVLKLMIKRAKVPADKCVTLYCNSCSFKAVQPQSYYRHLLLTHGFLRLNTVREINNERLHCSVCNIYFTDEKTFYNHLVNFKHDKQKLKIMCSDCCEIFECKERLLEHTKNHSPNNNVFPRTCFFCPKTLNHKLHESMHMVRKHPIEYELKLAKKCNGRLCELCGKVVSCYYYHKKSHEFEKSTPIWKIKCKFCVYKCKTVESTIMHILASHTNKPYCCTLCGRRFTTRCEVRDHILKIHAPVRPYTCKACYRHFSHLDYLNDHCIKVHDVDLKKTDKSVFRPLKNKFSLYVYPHLKIDGSLIEEELLKEAKIEICDYMDENGKPIDYNDAFFFDHTVDPNVPTKIYTKQKRKEAERMKNKIATKSKRIKPNATDITDELAEIKDDDAEIKLDHDYEEIKLDHDYEEIKIDHDYEGIKIDQEEIEHSNAEIEDDDAVIKDINSEIKDDNIINDYQNIDDDIDMDKKDIDNSLYENQYSNFKEEEQTPEALDNDDLDSLSSKMGLKDFNADDDDTTYMEEKLDDDEDDVKEMEIDRSSEEEVENDAENGDTERLLGELIEKDGQYYVFVDGELYRVESDE